MSEQAVPGRPEPPPDSAAPGTPRRRPSSRLVAVVRERGLVLSVIVALMVLGWAFFPDLFAPHDPLRGATEDQFLAPSGAHWFGTDNLGRDIYSRVVFGAALSLQAALIAVVVALTIGATIGLVAGFVGRWIDDVLMRIVEVVIAIPGILLSLAIVTALGFGMVNVALAVGIASMPSFARIMRAEVLRIRTADYVEAAQISGVRRIGVLVRHVLPNSAGPVLVLAALEFGTAILTVSVLSFLGFGAAPPEPEWGALVSEGRNYLAVADWMTTMPGLVIVAVVLAANRIARSLERGVA